MRVEQAQATKGSNNRLVGAVMGLALVAGALLSMGGTSPTKNATFFVEVGKPEAAEFVSAAPDSVSPREEIAERDSLDLQLD